MFKKLRNKFLVWNMAIISILLLGAFSLVYAFTYNQIQRTVEMRLDRALNPGMRPTGVFDHEGGLRISKNEEPGEPEDSSNNEAFPSYSSRKRNEEDNRNKFGHFSSEERPDNFPQPPQLTTDFTVETDQAGTIIKINSIFDLEDAVYQEAAAQALDNNKQNGRLRFENTLWAYKMLPRSEGGFRIAFLDMENERGMLQNLIVTFAAVGLLGLCGIFAISLLFANRAIRPIEQAWDKQTQFIADASHELKTPLTAINTNVDVLLSHMGGTAAEETKWLNYVKNEAERMTRLTNDLLYLARLDYDPGIDLSGSFCLSETVQNVLLAMEAVAFEKNAMLEYNIDDNLWIPGNHDQMKQLIMILLDNAMKYADGSTPIQIELHRAEKHALLTVSNTGTEIPVQDQDKIFDRFYRADKSRARNSGGYGLGLSIAKSITDRHRGKISVICQDGRTTFTVELPLSKPVS